MCVSVTVRSFSLRYCTPNKSVFHFTHLSEDNGRHSWTRRRVKDRKDGHHRVMCRVLGYSLGVEDIGDVGVFQRRWGHFGKLRFPRGPQPTGQAGIKMTRTVVRVRASRSQGLRKEELMVLHSSSTPRGQRYAPPVPLPIMDYAGQDQRRL